MPDPTEPNEPTPEQDAGDSTQTAGASSSESLLSAGSKVGPFTIERLLGQGGMGAVYLAEQSHPTRRVALKLLRPGFVSSRAEQRFELETEILARLEHPGIARMYEAGMHQGSPYFAMEFVQGPTLTEYAQSRQPTVRKRLELFAHICDAVHHAHSKGVIHRDLKPANILIDDRTDPDHPQPKILDFGVARLTDADLQSISVHTDAGQLVGTVPYMSPEQAAGDPSDLDTRSDIYALGVVLYELLAGRLPYNVKDKLLHEMVRIIREDDPTRLSSIHRSLGGDIETIVGKALEKFKERRYQSASDLASDIRRYLTDEPITARPPSAWYQLSKFTKRNKVLVGGTAAVFVALVAGIIVSTAQYLKAEAARGREAEQRWQAEQEAARATAIRSYLDEAYDRIIPEVAAQQRLALIRVADTTRERLDQEVNELPVSAVQEIRLILGRQYFTAQDYHNAIVQFRLALEPALAAEHSLTDEQLDGLHELLGVYMTVDLSRHVLDLLPRIIERTRRERGPNSGWELSFRILEAWALKLCQRHVEALAMLDEIDVALDTAPDADQPVPAVMGFDPPITWRRWVAAECAGQRVDCLIGLDRLDEARGLLVARRRQNLGTWGQFARLLVAEGRLEEAEMVFREMIGTREIESGMYPGQANTWSHLAYALIRQDRPDEAFALLPELLEQHRAMRGPADLECAWVLHMLAHAAVAVGDTEQARTVARELLAELEGAPDPLLNDGPERHFARARIRSHLAELLFAEGGEDEAITLLKQAYHDLQSVEVPLKGIMPRSYALTAAVIATNLAECCLLTGNLTAAEPYLDTAVENATQHLDVYPYMRVQLLQARLCLAEGNADAALRLADTVAQRRREKLGEAHCRTAEAQWVVGAALIRKGDFTSAEELLLSAFAVVDGTRYPPWRLREFIADELFVLYARTDREDEAETWLARGQEMRAPVGWLEVRGSLPPAVLHATLCELLSNESDQDIAVRLARTLRRQGRETESTAVLARARDRAGDDTANKWQVVDQQCAVSRKAKDYARQEELARQFLAEHPGFARAWHKLGWSLHDQKKYAEAAEAFRRGIAEGEGTAVLRDLDFHSSLGSALTRLGRSREAIEPLRESVRLRPEWSINWNRLGEAYLDVGQYAQAAEALDRATRLAPHNSGFWIDLGKALVKDGRFDEAIAAHRKGTQATPNWAETWMWLGHALREAQRFDEASEAYRKTVELEDGWSTAWLHYGGALRRAGRPEEALWAYRRGCEVDPDWEANCCLQLRVLRELGRYEECFTVARETYTRLPHSGCAWDLLMAAARELQREAELEQTLLIVWENLAQDGGRDLRIATTNRIITLYAELDEFDEVDRWQRVRAELSAETDR